jgi:CubicO group peptidase (beta-lactamase class C family)
MMPAPLLSAADQVELSPWIERDKRPGAIVGVLSGGRVRSWSSRGCGGLEAVAPPLTPTTVFYAASISKQFTAACEVAGDLDIERSVRVYVPELPPIFDPVTLRHLLHHLGGLPRGRDDMVGAPLYAID